LRDFRAHFGRDNLYTVKPEEFSIVDLLPDDSGKPALATFKADVVKGHFERGGDVIAGGATVRVDDVIHFEELGRADKADDLRYILFGTEQQFFLAHWITRPPDFDQALSVKVTGHQFTKDEINRERLVSSSPSLAGRIRHMSASNRVRSSRFAATSSEHINF
jgi:hypothetical protein